MSLITPYLYIGDAEQAQDFDLLKSKRVSVIINCAKEVPDFFPQSFEYVRLDLNDHPSQSLDRTLEPITNFIVKSIREGKVVFIHCRAGVSRSSSIAIATLMKLHKWDYNRCLKFVRDSHSITDPNEGFVRQLSTYTPGRAPPPGGGNGGSGAPPPRREEVEIIQSSGGYPTEETNVDIPYRPEDRGPVRQTTQPPNGVYRIPGAPPHQTEPPPRQPWSKLTMDGDEHERAEYSGAPGGRGLYAKIFT